MAKINYSAGKRQRERDKERKKKTKADRRDNRSGVGIPVATAEEVQGGPMMSIEEAMQSLRIQQGEEEAEVTSHASGIPSRLFVGGLDWSLNSDDLRKTFEAFGAVTDAVVVEDRDTGDSRGFGFVTMADRRHAAEATRQLNGTELAGRTLVIRPATERQR